MSIKCAYHAQEIMGCYKVTKIGCVHISFQKEVANNAGLPKMCDIFCHLNKWFFFSYLWDGQLHYFSDFSTERDLSDLPRRPEETQRHSIHVTMLVSVGFVCSHLSQLYFH